MSGAITAFSAAGFARSLIQSILVKNTRQIIWPIVDQSGAPALNNDGAPQMGTVGGYVAILEEHRDELEITRQPVEQGATIQDHAYKLPTSLTMQIGWSPSSAASSGLPSIFGAVPLPTLAGFTGQGNNALIKQTYQKLLTIQAQRSLLTITTGKRILNNMLLKLVAERTTNNTENALIITGVFEQINIAQVTVVNVPTNAAAQKAPQDTSPTQPQGGQQLQPGPSFSTIET